MIADVTRQPGKYLSTTREGVTPAGAQRSRVVRAGELILSNSGSVCIPKILKIDGCIHDGFVAFPDLSERVDLEFAYYWFEFIRPAIINQNRQGITQVNLNTQIVRQIPFPLASREEQRRVVTEIEKQLSRLENGNSSLRHTQKLLSLYRASLLKAAVEGRLLRGTATASAELSPSAPDRTTIPDGWQLVRLERLTRTITDGEHIVPTKTVSGTPLLSAKDVREDGVTFDDCVFVSDDDAARFRKRCNPALDDLLIVSRGATIGRTTVVRSERPFCLMGSVILVKVTPELDVRYLNIVLNSPLGKRSLTALSGSTAQQAIYLRDIRTLTVPLPTVQEQVCIVEEVERRWSIASAVRAAVAHSIDQSAAMRTSILKHAFTGRLHIATEALRQFA